MSRETQNATKRYHAAEIIFALMPTIRSRELLNALDVILAPYAKRLCRCAEPGCSSQIIRRKCGLYCEYHKTGAMRARRCRAKAKELKNAA